MNYLGLDYGASRIGVALAIGPLAEPLTTVFTRQALQSIKQLVKTHAVGTLVVGGGPESFTNDLLSLGLPVFIADETLSSHDARLSLLHTSRSRRRRLEHAAAAAVILQNWLDRQSSL